LIFLEPVLEQSDGLLVRDLLRRYLNVEPVFPRLEWLSVHMTSTGEGREGGQEAAEREISNGN
jgi:hypothetical protein